MNKVSITNLLPGVAMDCRPIAKCNSLRKAFTTALMAPFHQAFVDVTFPTQLGNREKAGGSQLIFGIQTMIKANWGHVALALDVENTFNEGEHKVMLDKLYNDEWIKESWYCNYCVLPVLSFFGLGNGPGM